MTVGAKRRLYKAQAKLAEQQHDAIEDDARRGLPWWKQRNIGVIVTSAIRGYAERKQQD